MEEQGPWEGQERQALHEEVHRLAEDREVVQKGVLEEASSQVRLQLQSNHVVEGQEEDLI